MMIIQEENAEEGERWPSLYFSTASFYPSCKLPSVIIHAGIASMYCTLALQFQPTEIPSHRDLDGICDTWEAAML